MRDSATKVQIEDTAHTQEQGRGMAQEAVQAHPGMRAATNRASSSKPVDGPTAADAIEAARRDLAAAEATLTAERRRRAATEAALAAHQHTAEVAERAAEAAGAADGALGINPLVGFTAEDIRAALQQIAGQALKQPQLALKHVAGLLAELGRGQWPYSEPGEPAHQPEGKLFHQPGAPRRPGAVAGRRAAAIRLVVGALARLALGAIGRAAARAADPRQPAVCAGGAGAGNLRV